MCLRRGVAIDVIAVSQDSLGTHTPPPRAQSDDYRGAMIFADAQRGDGASTKGVSQRFIKTGTDHTTDFTRGDVP